MTGEPFSFSLFIPGIPASKGSYQEPHHRQTRNPPHTNGQKGTTLA
jgi:hypothetical protein